MPRPDDSEAIEAFVRDVLASRKYRGLCEDTARDAIARALPRHRSAKDATKAAREMLHGIQAAFLDSGALAAQRDALEAAAAQGPDALRDACLAVMRAHASTRERLPLLGHFHQRIFDVTGVPRRVLDLASGIHPLSIPWMGLAVDAEYTAFEITAEMAGFLDAALRVLGMRGRAEVRDVVVRPPEDEADLALLLKAIPCLDRREAGASLRLMRALRVEWIVASYPVASLGGRSKGMRANYREQFLRLVDGTGWPVHEIDIEGELVFVVRKAAAP